jgi:hypothetical protein
MMPVAAIFSILLQVGVPSQASVCGLPPEGVAAEEFLKNAQIHAVRDLNTMAVTRPKKVELHDGQRTCYAVFKTIDESEHRKKFANGRTEVRFSDRYQYEIAAYELDKLLGLGIVPPVVERRIRREVGSLSLWVEDSITEWERLRVRDIHPPDTIRWNNQIYTIRLFEQLVFDTDYRNFHNLLVTPDWKIYKIDFSRAFRRHKRLRREESLKRFSRPALDSLRTLSRDQLKTHLCRWLSKEQIDSLWVRRGLILELADRRIAELGEEAALFD